MVAKSIDLVRTILTTFDQLFVLSVLVLTLIGDHDGPMDLNTSKSIRLTQVRLNVFMYNVNKILVIEQQRMWNVTIFLTNISNNNI